jgi:cell division septal protein FtsQ
MATPQVSAQNIPDDDLIPRYSASGQPVRRSYRLAFTLWTIFFLLVIAFTLFQYIMTWFSRKIG